MKKFFLLLFAVVSVGLFSACGEDPIREVAPVADRLLKDTAFELVEVSARSVKFPVIIYCNNRLENSCLNVDMAVPADSVWRMGIQSAGPASVRVDGVEVWRSAGGTGASFPREIAYDTWLFGDYATLRLSRGVHRVEVETTDVLSLGVVDSLDFAAGGVEYSVIEHGPEGEGYSEVRYPVAPGAAFAKHPYAEWHYANGATMLGLLALADASGCARYLDHVRRFCDFNLACLPLFEAQYARGSLRTQNYRLFRRGMLDDTTAPALPFLEYARRFGATDSLRTLLASMADYAMREQPRLSDGTFVRPEPRWTVWCDDLFMSAVFLMRYAAFTGDPDFAEEAVRQALAYDRYLRDPETGLVFHGWDATHGHPVGERWGRANGWFAWAFSEVLAHLDPAHPSYERLVAVHRRHLEALMRCQDAEGMWHQLLDRPETYAESSATASFVLALARAVRMGWVDGCNAGAARRGWRALARRIAPDGTMPGICRSMSIGTSAGEYAERPTLPNDPRGLGALFAAAAEMSMLNAYLKNEPHKP